MIDKHKIKDIKVHVISIPAKAVHSHGSGDVGSINSVILEISTDSGLTGWGEAAPWPVFTGTVEANAAALHKYIKPKLIGKNPFNVEKHLTMADNILVHCAEAKAALEVALLDIVGQATNLPIVELFGGRHCDSIPLSFSVANQNFETDLEDISKLYNDGVRIFKLKTGFSDHSFDLMRLEKLRKLYDDKISLRVDYNQGLKAYNAIRTLKDIESFKPEFIEQPVKKNEIEALSEITRIIDSPIMADESVFNAREAFIGAKLRIADIFSLKIMKSGGIRRAIEVASIARSVGISVYGGCMFETGIASTAGTHLMAAIPDLTLGCEFYMPTYYLQEDILNQPFPVQKGHVHIPTKPGLGIEVNLDVLSKYRINLLS